MVENRRKVALAQMSPILGDVTANLDKHFRYIGEAKAAGAALIVFPELGLTGYQVQDLTLDVARTLTHPDILRLIGESIEIDVVFSFVEESESHLFYISCVYASQGQVSHVHRKVYLPTYGMFDERRYFAPGTRMETFQGMGTMSGIMICEDAWHVTTPYLMALGGANLLLVPSCSPARSVTNQDFFGSQKFWRELLQVYAQLFGLSIIFVNRVGFEDGVAFFGGSLAVSAEGTWLLEAPTAVEGLFFADIDFRANRRARFATPIVRDERPLLVRSELSRILANRSGGDVDA